MPLPEKPVVAVEMAPELVGADLEDLANASPTDRSPTEAETETESAEVEVAPAEEDRIKGPHDANRAKIDSAISLDRVIDSLESSSEFISCDEPPSGYYVRPMTGESPGFRQHERDSSGVPTEDGRPGTWDAGKMAAAKLDEIKEESGPMDDDSIHVDATVREEENVMPSPTLARESSPLAEVANSAGQLTPTLQIEPTIETKKLVIADVPQRVQKDKEKEKEKQKEKEKREKKEKEKKEKEKKAKAKEKEKKEKEKLAKKEEKKVTTAPTVTPTTDGGQDVPDDQPTVTSPQGQAPASISTSGVPPARDRRRKLRSLAKTADEPRDSPTFAPPAPAPSPPNHTIGAPTTSHKATPATRSTESLSSTDSVAQNSPQTRKTPRVPSVTPTPTALKRDALEEKRLPASPEESPVSPEVITPSARSSSFGVIEDDDTPEIITSIVEPTIVTKEVDDSVDVPEVLEVPEILRGNPSVGTASPHVYPNDDDDSDPEGADLPPTFDVDEVIERLAEDEEEDDRELAASCAIRPQSLRARSGNSVAGFHAARQLLQQQQEQQLRASKPSSSDPDADDDAVPYFDVNAALDGGSDGDDDGEEIIRQARIELGLAPAEAAVRPSSASTRVTVAPRAKEGGSRKPRRGSASSGAGMVALPADEDDGWADTGSSEGDPVGGGGGGVMHAAPAPARRHHAGPHIKKRSGFRKVVRLEGQRVGSIDRGVPVAMQRGDVAVTNGGAEDSDDEGVGEIEGNRMAAVVMRPRRVSVPPAAESDHGSFGAGGEVIESVKAREERAAAAKRQSRPSTGLLSYPIPEEVDDDSNDGYGVVNKAPTVKAEPPPPAVDEEEFERGSEAAWERSQIKAEGLTRRKPQDRIGVVRDGKPRGLMNGPRQGPAPDNGMIRTKPGKIMEKLERERLEREKALRLKKEAEAERETARRQNEEERKRQIADRARGRASKLEKEKEKEKEKLAQAQAQQQQQHGPSRTPAKPEKKVINQRPQQRVQSNRPLIRNALLHVCLAGTVNDKVKQDVLDDLADSTASHFIILFRGPKNHAFRGLYSFDPNLHQVLKVYAPASGAPPSDGDSLDIPTTPSSAAAAAPINSGPATLLEEDVAEFYKYDSGSRGFKLLPTKSFGISVHAVALHSNFGRRSK
ncbi:hypothetical protein HK101_004320 [Irineochytrium annulatum]|nr:hypothetical protein HK101_004320 [Irineochytrium annulatum]